MINSRPLSYVSAEDIEEPLTPSHLIVGRRILNLPDHIGDLDDEEFSTDSVQLTKRVKHLNNTLNHFWNRWRTEYLNELREAHGHHMRKSSTIEKSTLSVGDVVIVHDEQLPRGLWKLGRIQELFKGRDGHYRGATVRMATRDRQQVLLRRPIQLLYPLELKSADDKPSAEESRDAESVRDSKEPPVDTTSESEVADTPIETQRRPRRVAAQLGDERRKACMFELVED